MTTTVQTQSDYRDLPLDWLIVSPTNPRKTFDEDAMQELAASIRENGVLQPLLVRPRTERSFEIVFGERRYRGAAMAKLVQITTAYGKPAEGSTVVPRGQYVEIRQEKPKNKYQQEAPEYKTCKFVTQAIVADGTDKGEFRKVCANPDCPVHHPKKQQRRTNTDAAMKAAQQEQRREDAQAQATGLRVLKAIGDAIPVRLMKRDLLFVVSRLSAMLDERKLAVLIRQHGVGKPKNGDAPAKLLAAFLPKAEESKLGRILVETVILLSTHNQADAAKILRDAAQEYKVDVEAISATVKEEFAAKDKGKASKKATPKSAPKPAKKAAA